MRETYQNILIAVCIAFLIVLAILFYNQQKTINRLSESLKNQNNIAPVEKNETMKGTNVDQIDRDQKSSEATVKFIEGKLISVSGNDLTVEADMLDWQKMKEPRTGSNTSLTYKKNYTVTIDGETKFFANKLDAIKVGDTIQVTAKELVYRTDKLTAVFIMSPVAKPAP